MSKFDIPLAPMIMSFVLGETIETNLRRALMYSNGDISTFVTSPISCVFLVAAAISIVLTIRKQLNDRKKQLPEESNRAPQQTLLNMTRKEDST